MTQFQKVEKVKILQVEGGEGEGLHHVDGIGRLPLAVPPLAVGEPALREAGGDQPSRSRGRDAAAVGHLEHALRRGEVPDRARRGRQPLGLVGPHCPLHRD